MPRLFSTDLFLHSFMDHQAEDTSRAVQVGTARLSFAIAASCAVALWNFVLLFRGWVVASQAELLGANMLFFFLGVVPWVGILASSRRRLWGPYLILASAIVGATGVPFTRVDDWWMVAMVLAITVAPMIGIALILRRALIIDR